MEQSIHNLSSTTDPSQNNHFYKHKRAKFHQFTSFDCKPSQVRKSKKLGKFSDLQQNFFLHSSWFAKFVFPLSRVKLTTTFSCVQVARTGTDVYFRLGGRLGMDNGMKDSGPKVLGILKFRNSFCIVA